MTKLDRDVAGYRKESKVFLASRGLGTRGKCNAYLRDVVATMHHMVMADVFPPVNWKSCEYRVEDLRYAQEHLDHWMS